MTNDAWSDTKASWRAAQDALIDRFRPLYMAELARFAEELRPEFEAGALHGYTDEDFERECADGWRAPFTRLEDLCVTRFGIEVDDAGGYRVERDPATAALILASSPSADACHDDGCLPSSNAGTAIAWDVIAIARARGWYTPAPDESCPSVESTRWAQAG